MHGLPPLLPLGQAPLLTVICKEAQEHPREKSGSKTNVHSLWPFESLENKDADQLLIEV